MGMLEKVQALLTITGQAGGGGGGGADITVDSVLSKTSTNPIQNQYLGKRMGATSSNSVQIGYNAKAGMDRNESVVGRDDGFQVAVGNSANGSVYGAAVGRNANGSNSGVAVGYNTNGSNYGAAIGLNANGGSYGAAIGAGAQGNSRGVAIGYNANGGSSYDIAIGVNSTTNYTSYTATIGVESSNDTQYSLQISAYNNEQNTFFVQRLVAGETLDTSYIDFYHRDRVSSEFKGRRISATNFFKLLDANGAIDISGGGGDHSGDVSA